MLVGVIGQARGSSSTDGMPHESDIRTWDMRQLGPPVCRTTSLRSRRHPEPSALFSVRAPSTICVPTLLGRDSVSHLVNLGRRHDRPQNSMQHAQTHRGNACMMPAFAKLDYSSSAKSSSPTAIHRLGASGCQSIWRNVAMVACVVL